MDQNAPFPGGRLFSYGTLMFEAVVRALLGRVVLSRPATLADYERQAIEREAGGAKGPVLFPAPGGTVRGRVLEGLAPREQALLDRFESAAGGYERLEVEVATEAGETLNTAVYCARDELRRMSGGTWSAETFERDHLEHYVSERIPRLLAAWREEDAKSMEHAAGHETVTNIAGPLSTEEKQVLYLKRNWEILEAFKAMRSRIPIATTGASIIITGWAMETDIEEPVSVIAVVLALLLMSVLGAYMLYRIRKQYLYTDGKIDNLYEQLGMEMDSKKSREYRYSAKNASETAADIFLMGQLAIGGVFLACLLALAARYAPVLQF